MQIDIIAEWLDLSDIVYNLIIRNEKISFLISTERTIQITGIRDFQIDPFHKSILQ